ncbi:hypothetical protein E2C01_042800 [Portunus trituberculatus]|uniref:Uncharacterized protein n=1 Tax=Portunus trituberculatus TaxID=210409 RepID=A0A5B7FR67_PORTR|nr:hypothetical protein [Portunus trituberculatus]
MKEKEKEKIKEE